MGNYELVVPTTLVVLVLSKLNARMRIIESNASLSITNRTIAKFLYSFIFFLASVLCL